MARHNKTTVWTTSRGPWNAINSEWGWIETADRSHLKITVKSAETAGNVSTRIRRRTARRLAEEILACLEATK